MPAFIFFGEIDDDEEEEQWVEAEQWLAHHYPQHWKWKAWTTGENIFIQQYDYRTGHANRTTISRDAFKMLVAAANFDAAMRHVLVMGQLMNIRELFPKPGEIT